MEKLNEPPRLANRFLHWFCASHLLEAIEGDLSELYHERVTHEGKLKAQLLYLADVLKIFRPYFFKISYPNQTVFAMELKKHPSVDLRKKYALFLSIGLLISLTLVTTAFEWRTYEGPVVDITSVTLDDGDLPEIMPVTIINPPPPPPKAITVVEVPDEEEVEDIDVVIEMPELHEPVAPPIEFEEVPEEEAEVIHLVVEEKPSFEGGIEAFYRYVSKNLKYPNTAKRIGVEGKVFLSFVIDKDGSITQVEVLKGIGGDCDEEAVRVLENAPRWNPGKQRGKAVKVRMQLPIVFALQ